MNHARKIFSLFFLMSLLSFSVAFAGSSGLDDLYAQELGITFRMQSAPIDEAYQKKKKRMLEIAERKYNNLLNIKERTRGYGKQSDLINELLPWEVDFVGEDLFRYYETMGYLYWEQLDYENAQVCFGKMSAIHNEGLSIMFLGVARWLDFLMMLRNGYCYLRGDTKEDFQQRFVRNMEIIDRLIPERGQPLKQKNKEKNRRRRGGSAFDNNKLPWTIDTQHEWAQTLQRKMQELRDLDYNFSHQQGLFNTVEESVRTKSENWLKRNEPTNGTQEIFHILMDQISRLRAQALRDMANTSTSWLSIPYISRPSLAVAGNPNRQQALKDVEDRKQKLEAARARKLERRANLQTDMKEKGPETEDESTQKADIPVHFAGGKEGTFAQKLFEAEGTDTLGNLIQIKAAEMLSVFAVSRGIQDLVDNMYATGKSKSGLNLEKLHGENRWSIRVNDQYRICFNWDHKHQCWQGLWFGDYHKQK